jgi:hypothetical protein
VVTTLIMSVFQIEVRDYTEVLPPTRRNGAVRLRRVQSPQLDLRNTQPPFVFRPTKGNSQQHETFIVSDASTLRDDVGQPPYLADAQGVLVQPDSQRGLHPIWVVRTDKFDVEKTSAIDVVDLINYEHSKVRCSKVCWVPQLETAEGTLVTFLNECPQRRSGKDYQAMIMQTLNSPEKTELMYDEAMPGLKPIDGLRRRYLFETQLAALRTSMRTPSVVSSLGSTSMPTLETLRTNLQRLTSSLRPITGSPMENEPMQKMGPPSLDWGSTDDEDAIFTDYSSDDDSANGDAVDTHQLEAPRRVCIPRSINMESHNIE